MKLYAPKDGPGPNPGHLFNHGKERRKDKAHGECLYPLLARTGHSKLENTISLLEPSEQRAIFDDDAVDNINVKIDAPRTPFYLRAAIKALTDELHDLDGINIEIPAP